MKFLFIVGTEDRLFYIKKAAASLRQSWPDFDFDCHSAWALQNAKEEDFEGFSSYDFAFIYFHGGAHLLSHFTLLWDKVVSHMPVFFVSSIPEEMAELMPQSSLSPSVYREMNRYFDVPHQKNYEAMIQIGANSLGCHFVIPPKEEVPMDGYYVGGKILDAQEEALFRKEMAITKKPIVGLILHQNNIIADNRAHIDETIATLDGLGAFPIPLFSRMSEDEDKKSGIQNAIRRYFMKEEQVLPQAVIVMSGFSMRYIGNKTGDFETSIFDLLKVPVLQLMTTYFTREEYEEKPQGIDSMSINIGVFQPELDGQIITVPAGTGEIVGVDGFTRRLISPLKDRIQRVCKLAMGWAKLRTMQAENKKVAIIFHNLPGNDRIGCAEGLDSFQSVYELMQVLKEEGVAMAYDFKDGTAIIEALTGAITNDITYASAEKIKALCADEIGPFVYEKWWAEHSETVQHQIEKRWGPSPGELMVQGQHLIIPGIFNGNVYVGIQPNRATEDKHSELYHSTDATPPYSYIAFYRWLEEVFQADVICHIGTHGTLEWLPGKEVGLSKNCYPDICLGSVPHLYLYHIGITGEGIQAKRRSHAVILEHMIPAMQESGTYGDLTVIDDALKEYTQAKRFSPTQVPAILDRIDALVQSLHLGEDVGLTRADYQNAPEESIRKLHLWMGALKNSVTRDGLHIFGQVPEGDLMDSLLRMMVRVPNGQIPSLYDGVLWAMGYEPAHIKDEKGPLAHQYIYDKAVAMAQEISRKLAEENYEQKSILELVEAFQFEGDTEPLIQVLDFLCREVRPKVCRTTDELEHFRAGLKGRFVKPGKGGNPTRGNVDILPTGRNFYAGDPAEIPSRGAMAIGQILGEKTLAKYKAEKGKYPESIAMIIWAGNTLKTCGEDLAEAFYLMGVKPRYLGNTAKVIGIEPVPMEQLKRPRIDVTIRISGLFRDMYPNLIGLMDQAVNVAAAQAESIAENYIKKHFEEDIAQLVTEDISFDAASERAKVRVFSAAPGTYGAGVSHLIESKGWESYEDIAQVYSNFSSHGYSAAFHGERMQDVFEKRLSTVEVTIKNESTIEIDMFSSDDFYAYHGGLIACVKKQRGEMPMAITGHTEDMERPEIRTVNEETARIMRTKVLHPKWLKGLQRHGYKGAQEVVMAVNHLFGWDATASAGKDWMYDQIADTFLLDEEIRNWLSSVNKWSVHSISERLIESGQRGLWQVDPEKFAQIKAIYLAAEGLIEEGEE